MDKKVHFIIIGGGIAGVSCAENLLSYLPNCQVTIVSASPLVKAVRNLQEISRALVAFDVEETPIEDYVADKPQIVVHGGKAVSIDQQKNQLATEQGNIIPYDKLCVCTGARPKVIFPESKYVLGIRDTVTVQELDLKLKDAERIVVVGNGGIATELVFQVTDCEVVWVIKDKAIGQVFFDPGAAEFFLPFLKKKREHKATSDLKAKTTIKRMNYKLENEELPKDITTTGNALGPDWHQSLNLKGTSSANQINVQYNCEVKKLLHNQKESMAEVGNKKNGQDWPLIVELTNGKHVGCDFIVSATGVVPNVDVFKGLSCKYAEDGGVEVDENMRVTGCCNIYAAGDVCSTNQWPYAPHWHQMRLWTQARQMGAFAAQCMVEHRNLALNDPQSSEDIPLNICFSLFAHVTNFFGKKICLLGRYNGQDLNKQEIELLVRTTPNDEYIKVILKNGRMQGAVLIGETDLEETFENLIMNETDLSFLGEGLLDPNVDITDYFD